MKQILTLSLLLINSISFANLADFSYNNHCINNLIYFEDLSTAVDDEVVSWFWEFGDQSVSTDNSPVHAYTESGIYNVNLTIQTLKGKSYSKLKSIEIKSAPFAFFNPKNLCDKKVRFTDNTYANSDKIKSWIWDFGDGEYSLDQNPEHQFSEDEKSNIHLKVLDKNGCWDSISQSVKIIKNPKTGFDINNVILTNPAVIKINSHNKSDSLLYLINDELIHKQNGFIQVPSHQEVSIKQKVINEFGCIDSIQQKIKANKEYKIPLPPFFQPVSGNNKSTFGINDESISVNEFIIHDSSGREVFNGNNLNKKWNGRDEKTGNPCLSGVYVYVLSYENSKKVKVLQKGKLILKQ